MSAPPPIIDIADLELVAPSGGEGCRAERLQVARGDIVAIAADLAAFSRLLLRLLATLHTPPAGSYRFAGRAVDIGDDRRCLEIKRRIGYVAADAAMISNLTLRENLLLMRYYLENDLTITIDSSVAGLCRDAGLYPALDERPAVLSDGQRLKAITIREMAKAPVVMLIDRPENFIELSEADAIFRHLKRRVLSGMAVVFYSTHDEMKALANRTWRLECGAIRTDNV